MSWSTGQCKMKKENTQKEKNNEKSLLGPDWDLNSLPSDPQTPRPLLCPNKCIMYIHTTVEYYCQVIFTTNNCWKFYQLLHSLIVKYYPDYLVH